MVRLTKMVVAAAMGLAAGDLATLAPVTVATVAPLDVATVAPVAVPAATPIVVSDDKDAEPSAAKASAEKSETADCDGFSDCFMQGWNKTSEKQTPQEKFKNWAIQTVIILIFACIYKSKVVDQYPDLGKPSERSKQLQAENEFCAMFNGCCSSNFLLSWCCLAPRAAHTFDKTETLGFWPGVAMMILFPWCTLTYTNACTDMNEKLGGEKRNIVMSCLCAWCCACCVVLQDAESLDAATGAKTECCGVNTDDVEGGSSSAGE